MDSDPILQDPTDRLALRLLCRHAALALSDPKKQGGEAELRPDVERALDEAWRFLGTAAAAAAEATSSPGERDPESVAIAPVLAWLGRSPEVREAALLRVFGLTSSRVCPACEGEYLPSRDPTHRAQHLADLCGFYLAHGLEVSPERAERPDHVSIVLEFVAFVLEKIDRLAEDDAKGARESYDVCRSSLRSFCSDHLVWWLPSFAATLAGRAEQVLPFSAGEEKAALSDLCGVADWLAALSLALRANLKVGARSERVFPNPDPVEAADGCGGCGAIS